MSRSRRRTKIFGNAVASSEKQDKRKANRALRRRVKSGDYDAMIKDVSDPWAFNKDGKNYWEDATEKDMRK